MQSKTERALAVVLTMQLLLFSFSGAISAGEEETGSLPVSPGTEFTEASPDTSSGTAPGSENDSGSMPVSSEEESQSETLPSETLPLTDSTEESGTDEETDSGSTAVTPEETDSGETAETPGETLQTDESESTVLTEIGDETEGETTAAESEAESKAAAEAESTAASEAESTAASEAKSQAASEAESKAAAESESIAASEAESTASSEAESSASSEAESTASSEGESQAASEAESTAASEAESTASSEAESTASSEAESTASSEAESTASSEAESTASSEAESTAASEAESTASSEAESMASSEAESTASSEAESTASSEAESMASSEAESTASSEAESTASSEAESAASSEAESTASSEAESERIRTAREESERESEEESEKEEKERRKREMPQPVVQIGGSTGGGAHYGRAGTGVTIGLSHPLLAAANSQAAGSQTAGDQTGESSGSSGSYSLSVSYRILSADGGSPVLHGGEWQRIEPGGTISLGEDGSYIVEARTEDSDGNVAYSRSGRITIDSAEPLIHVSGVTDGSVMAAAPVISVDCRDLLYKPGSLHAVVTGPDGSEAASGRLVSEDAQNASLSFASFENSRESDGQYTLTVRAEDLAGNAAEYTMTFTLDRYGSSYRIGGDTAREMETYVHQQAFPVVLEEENPAEITSRKILLQSEDGQIELIPGRDYTVTMIQEGGKTIYQYRISPSLFSGDGAYKVMALSVDTAGNTADSSSQNAVVSFAIDRTGPECLISGIESGGRYQADSLTAAVEVRDNIALASAAVYVNGQKTQEYQAQEISSRGGVLKVTFVSSPGWQRFQVCAVDQAGNESWSPEIPFLLSPASDIDEAEDYRKAGPSAEEIEKAKRRSPEAETLNGQYSDAEEQRMLQFCLRKQNDQQGSGTDCFAQAEPILATEDALNGSSSGTASGSSGDDDIFRNPPPAYLKRAEERESQGVRIASTHSSSQAVGGQQDRRRKSMSLLAVTVLLTALSAAGLWLLLHSAAGDGSAGHRRDRQK